MRMLPEKVTILGLEYKVEEVEVVDMQEALWGKIDYENLSIRIDASLSDARKQQTLLHEVLHGILEELGYRKLNEDENAVQGIAAALYCILKSPTILDWRQQNDKERS